MSNGGASPGAREAVRESAGWVFRCLKWTLERLIALAILLVALLIVSGLFWVVWMAGRKIYLSVVGDLQPPVATAPIPKEGDAVDAVKATAKDKSTTPAAAADQPKQAADAKSAVVPPTLEEIGKKFAEYQQPVLDKLKGHEAQLGEHEACLADHEARLRGLAGQVKAIEDRQSRVEGVQEGFQRGLVVPKAPEPAPTAREVKEISSHLKTIGNNVDGLRGQVTALGSTVQDLSGKAAAAAAEAKAAREAVGGLKDDMKRLSEQKLTQQKAEIQALWQELEERLDRMGWNLVRAPYNPSQPGTPVPIQVDHTGTVKYEVYIWYMPYSLPSVPGKQVAQVEVKPRAVSNPQAPPRCELNPPKK